MNRIKELRNTLKLSQKEFAKEMGVAQNTISNWENEIRLMDSDTTKKLASYFKVSTDYLLGLTENPSPINEVFAAHVKNGGDYSDLPPEALTELDNYRQYLREKYKKK